MIYLYRCKTHGMFERDFTMGRAQPESHCPACNRLGYRVYGGVNVQPTSQEARDRVRAVDSKEGRWSIDMPAYRRLRSRGLHPHRIDGSAGLEERVEDQVDIDHSRLYSYDGGKARVIEALDQVRDYDEWTPVGNMPWSEPSNGSGG